MFNVNGTFYTPPLDSNPLNGPLKYSAPVTVGEIISVTGFEMFVPAGDPYSYTDDPDPDNPVEVTNVQVPSAIGTVGFTFNPGAAGNYSVIGFFDAEIDEWENTYYNEYGNTNGSLDPRQSWEIDEPGWVNGDIYDNVSAGQLDNGIGISIYGDTTFPDDISMAMGWEFELAANQIATIVLNLSPTAPSSGFYLAQIDSDTDETIYFSSTLDIHEATAPVPEPATMLLLGTGLAGLFGFGRKKIKA